MTSGQNHDETVDFFKNNNFFGGEASSFMFFQQASLPLIDQEGKILIKSQSGIQLGPNGNGALFDSINNNPVVQNHIKNVDFVQVIGVDNVLNKIMDPIQVGYQHQNKLDATLKVLVKRSPDEKVGVVCKKNGMFDIVEYSELSSE